MLSSDLAVVWVAYHLGRGTPPDSLTQLSDSLDAIKLAIGQSMLYRLRYKIVFSVFFLQRGITKPIRKQAKEKSET